MGYRRYHGTVSTYSADTSGPCTVGTMPRRRPQPAPPPPAADVDLNQVVAYNVRAARELRGWTQEEVSQRLEPYLGQRLTQAGISAIERAWDGDRRREFDAHELLIFSMVFDLPILWFLLPPPDDHRLMAQTTRPVDELYMYLLGRPEQLEPVYARLREIGVTDPTAAEQTVEKITGQPAGSRQWSYRERRKELLLALLDQHADDLDNAIDELGPSSTTFAKSASAASSPSTPTTTTTPKSNPRVRTSRHEAARRTRRHLAVPRRRDRPATAPPRSSDIWRTS